MQKTKSTIISTLIMIATAGWLSIAHSEPVSGNENTGALKVTLLGTGSPVLDINRFGPSVLVNAGGKLFLFDGGRGAATRISQVGNPYSIMPHLRHVFLTHLHSDHLIGLTDIYMTGWLYGRSKPMYITGPSGSQAMMDHLRNSYESDIDFRSELIRAKNPTAGLDVLVKEIDKSQLVYDEAGVKITAFLVEHGHIEPAFGYKIEYSGKSVILSGDTSYSENLVAHAKNADLIIHEVAQVSPAYLKSNPQWNTILSGHTLPRDAGRVFSETAPKLAVYSHIILVDISADEVLRQTRETYSGDLLVGHDLMQIILDDDIKIIPRDPQDNLPLARN
jgi:ribonuclease Z